MPRGLISAVKTKLASGKFAMAHLLKLELNTTYKYTDFANDIVDGPVDTYTANGFLQGIGAITESSNINIGSMDISISAVNQTIVSDVLNNGHLHRNVTVKRAILNDDNTVAGSFQIYAGFIEGMSIRDSADTSIINFAVANHWADFERIEGRRTNESSQQHYFSGDKCFEFADQAGKRVYWGNVDVIDFTEDELNWQHGGPEDSDVPPGTTIAHGPSDIQLDIQPEPEPQPQTGPSYQEHPNILGGGLNPMLAG